MLNYTDPTITKWEVDSQGNKTSVEVTNEIKTIIKDKFVLEGMPDEYYRVQLANALANINGTPTTIEFTEIGINDKISSVNQFKVDYRKTGIVFFHPDLDGVSVTVSRYYSKGLVYFPASRIWTKTEGEYIETLDGLLDGADTAIGIINQLDTYVDDAKIELDSHTDLKEVELDNYTTTKELQLNLYTESKEGDLDLYTINKQGELDSHLTLKQNELDAYTITKQTQLDNYVLNTNQAALDLYVTNTSKPEIDTYVLNKESDLDVHTATKEAQLNIYTGIKETQLDNYTSVREIQLDDYTTLKEGDLETYANLKLSDINAAIVQLPYIGLNNNWFEWDFNIEAYVDSGVSAIGPQGIQGVQGPEGPIGEPGMTWRGTYTNETDYIINDGVLYKGSSYRAIAANKNIIPTNTASWILLASKGEVGGMDPAVYDPSAIQADVFSMANMVESTEAKVLTATERANIVNLMGVRAVIGTSPPEDSDLWIDTN